MPSNQTGLSHLVVLATSPLVLAGAILGIIAYVFHMAISGLLAASGVIAIVLGLALQSTLGDLFSVTAFKVRALTKAIVCEIGRDDISPILTERPAVAAELSQMMLRREAAGKALLDHIAPDGDHSMHFSARVTERMKRLFGIVGLRSWGIACVVSDSVP